MNLRKLYEHLDSDARRVVSDAADLAARNGHLRITIELLLLSAMRDRTAGAQVMQGLERAGVDAARIETALAAQVAAQPRAPSNALPSFDTSTAHLLREAWSLSFDEYGDTAVAPLRLFETVARRGEAWPKLVAALPGFDRIDVAKLAAQVGSTDATDADGGGGAARVEGDDAQYRELSRYGHDMIAQARDGGLDPVIGFDAEASAIAAILLRRRQNSVIVVGEAGVGKSACAQGMVQRIAQGGEDVPDALHGTPIWALDLSALRAGAVVRGALEERLQAIVNEVQGQAMILYVDDIHLLFSEHGGGGDALRSILSKGDIRILGTCGWREWRRYVEPDAGLARRIAPIRVQEPDDAHSMKIVEGIAPGLTEHHQVTLDSEIMKSAVSLSRRYIVGRRLPDKAIVALDSACARTRIDRTRERDDEGRTKVTCDDVARIVADLTGVPIGSMLSDVSAKARELETTLLTRIVGQDKALERCAAQTRAYLAGLSERRRPVGALMFCGPSGVGKTETAHALAETLFGGRLLTINMSEYQEAHTVSGLKGAPAGYVGYGEGGVLTEGIRRTPYCVVLLDEIEKAHKDVIEMLYQVLDRGWMEDAEGIEADFSNALIILTTNAGDMLIEKVAATETPPNDDEVQQLLTRELSTHFPPAFIGRLQLVPYQPLDSETLKKIAGMRLDRLAQTYEHSHQGTLRFDENARSWLAERVRTTPQGARFLDTIIAKTIRPIVADHVLAKLAQGERPGNAVVVHEEEQFQIHAEDPTG